MGEIGFYIIKKLFMNRTLKFRMTFLYSILAVLIISATSFCSYYVTVNILKQKETVILEDSIEYLESQISFRIADINEEFISIFTAPKFLELYLQNEHAKNDFAHRTLLEWEYREYLGDIRVRNHDLVHSILLVTNNRLVFSDDLNPLMNYTQFVESSYYEDSISKTNIIQFVNSEPKDINFAILRSFYFMTDKSADSALPTAGYESRNREDYSTIVFFLKKSYLQKILDVEAQKRSTAAFILDRQGNIVVKAGEISGFDLVDYQQLFEREVVGEYGSKETAFGGKKIGVHHRTIDYADWKIVYAYDQNILYKEAGRIRSIAVVISIMAIGAVVLLANIISNTIVKPIRKLGQSMDDALVNNLEAQFIPKYNDEISDLSRTFNVLLGKVSDLVNDIKVVEAQKREEELKALQAQINPHFLYNTLDTVYWLAKLDGNDNIGELISDLASFFRLSLNKGEDITTVERELEHVEKYLEIQRVRSDNSFDFNIAVEDSVRNYFVPKLILQPLVENSIIHGFSKLTQQGYIDIKVSGENDILQFVITDNGSGMAKDVMRRMNARQITVEKKGYAIENVIERIVLYAGKGYGILYDEDYCGGTRVYLTFPGDFQYGGKQNGKDDHR